MSYPDRFTGAAAVLSAADFLEGGCRRGGGEAREAHVGDGEAAASNRAVITLEGNAQGAGKEYA